ncbi:MAG: ABC transporter ATP-binding protein [Prevotella sp.]|nr:ABC transporter ATP-binding protein [Prevotella sp.]
MVGININNLKKSFGENVAVDIDHFEIHKGDMLGLVGNNGAGKTTLFRLLLDLLEANEGEIGIIHPSAEASINPAKSEEWKQFTGAYIDEAFLIDFLTPEEYFQFVAQANRMTQEETDERLAPFEHFMQGEILGQKKLIRDLSAGNKQKVGIISTMLTRPDLIILDEPFNFLDPSSQIILKRLLKEYHETTGATILISSHNLQHTIDISTRIALLEKGHIVKDLLNEAGSAEAELEQYFNVE